MPATLGSAVVVREARANDAPAIARIGRENASFYARLAPELFRVPEEYGLVEFIAADSDWRADPANLALVAEVDGEVAGFITLRLNSADEGEGALFAVTPAARRAGLGRSLLVRSLEWLAGQGRRRMVISTQVTNVRVQRIWTRLGFEPSHSFYTFHQWLDR